MDSSINAAARALATGDVLGALNRVALRDDAPALALQGIAMAQLGEFDRAKALLKRAARGFGAREPMARARCILAEAEIALVSRDLNWPPARLEAARSVLAAHGDRPNAAHASVIAIRRHLLLGQLAETRAGLATLDPEQLPPALRAGYGLVAAGLAIRQVQIAEARRWLAQARRAAEQSGIAALLAEVETAQASLMQPAALLRQQDRERAIALDEVEALLSSDTLLIDATRTLLSQRATQLRLSTRPILFKLLRALAEAWPGDASRNHLLAQAFGARQADESHRARLRVEMTRLRQAIAPLATISATPQGFRLKPKLSEAVALLASPLGEQHGAIMALLADGEVWASSALALVLDLSPRSIQRALADLQRGQKVQPVGRGRARRWTMLSLPGFPTSLLLPRP